MQAQQPLRLSTRHRRMILVSLLLSAAAYLFVVLYTGYDKVIDAFITIGLFGWIFLIGCSFLSYIVRFIRWQMYIRQAGWHIEPKTHFLYYLAGFALTTTPGKAGETIRSVLLRPHGVPYPVSLACFFSERLLDVIVIGLLASLTVTIFDDYDGFVLVTCIAIFLCLLLIRSPLIVRLFNYISRKTYSRWLHRIIFHSTSLLQTAQQFLRWRLLVFGTSLGLLAWVIQGLAFYFIVFKLGLEISLLAAMGIYAISLLAGAVSFIPGGVGTTELVMGVLISLLGAEPAVAVAAPLISRLSTLWFAVVLGLGATTILSLRKPIVET